MKVITDGVQQKVDRYVGTLVGESASGEFRLVVAHETIREQDIIAVNAELRQPAGAPVPERIRVWAKVRRIERLNPLFPAEAGHELAATGADPFETVLSLSREMVTAVCQVLGAEPLDGSPRGKLEHVRYPPRPASSAYRPASEDIARVVLGELQQHRALDIATLSNRPEVSVTVDGHNIVTRHLAILAMTGAGKSWTARRIIEQLAEKNYPIIIFDPHGDYTGLSDVPALQGRVKVFHAHLPVLEEDTDDAARIVSGLSGEEMTSPQLDAFDRLFAAAQKLLTDELLAGNELRDLLDSITKNPNIMRFGLRKDLFALSFLAEAVQDLAEQDDTFSGKRRLIDLGFDFLEKVDRRQAGTFRVLARQLRRAAFKLRDMEKINRDRTGRGQPLPSDRHELVRYGQIAVISLAGYAEEFQATLYNLIANHLFASKVRGRLRYPYLMVLEEAHNFVPGSADHPAVRRSIATTKQIAQEGRKFNVGLILISQRPSRLDETTLSQCNSYVIMRMVNPADQGFVRRVIETLGEDEARMLPDLDVGEAILSGQLANFPVLVKIKEPVSKGEHEEEDAFMQLGKLRAGQHEPA